MGMARGPPPVTAPPPRVRVRRNGSAETVSPPARARARIDPDAALGHARPISPSGSAVSAPPSAPMRTGPSASPSYRLSGSGSGTAPRTRVGPLFHTPPPARTGVRASSKGATAAHVAAQAPARARVDMSALFPDSGSSAPSQASRTSPAPRPYGFTSPPGSVVSAGPAPSRPTVRKVQSSNSVAHSPSWAAARRGPSPSPSQGQGPVVAQAHVHPSLASPRSPPPHAHTLSTSPLGPASQADLSHITFARGGQGHARTLSSFSSGPRVPRSRSDSNASTPSATGMPAVGATAAVELSAPPSPASSAMSKRRSLQSPDPELVLGTQALESVSEVGEPTLNVNPSPGRRWTPTPVQFEVADQVEQETRKLEEEAKKDRKILDLEISNRSLLAINEALEVTKLQQAQEIRELKRRLRQGIVNGSAEDVSWDDEDEGSDTSGSATDESGSAWDEHEGQGRKDAPLKLMEDPVLAKLNLRCRKLVEDMTSRARAALAFEEPTKSHVGTGGKVLHPAEVAALRANDPDASTDATDDPSLSVEPVAEPVAEPAAMQSSPLSPAGGAHLPSRHASESDGVLRETSTSDTEASTASISISQSHSPSQSRSQIVARVPSHTILPPKVSLRHSTPPPPGELHAHGLPNGGVLVLGSDDADEMQVSVNGAAPPPSPHVLPTSPSLGVASTLRPPRPVQLKPRISSVGADISLD